MSRSFDAACRGGRQGLPNCIESGAPDVLGVLLHQAVRREGLIEWLLRSRDDRARRIENDGAGTRCALIDCEDVRHRLETARCEEQGETEPQYLVSPGLQPLAHRRSTGRSPPGGTKPPISAADAAHTQNVVSTHLRIRLNTAADLRIVLEGTKTTCCMPLEFAARRNRWRDSNSLLRDASSIQGYMACEESQSSMP